MDYRKMAIDDLRKHKYRRKSIENLSTRIEALNASLGGLQSPKLDGPRSENNPHAAEEKTINTLAEIERCKIARNLAAELTKLVESGLDNLSEDERLILETFYIDRPAKHIDVLMDQLHIGKSPLYRKKEIALKNFALSMYGLIDA